MRCVGKRIGLFLGIASAIFITRITFHLRFRVRPIIVDTWLPTTLYSVVTSLVFRHVFNKL